MFLFQKKCHKISTTVLVIIKTENKYIVFFERRYHMRKLLWTFSVIPGLGMFFSVKNYCVHIFLGFMKPIKNSYNIMRLFSCCMLLCSIRHVQSSLILKCLGYLLALLIVFLGNVVNLPFSKRWSRWVQIEEVS